MSARRRAPDERDKRIAELEAECSARLRAASIAYEKLGIVEGLAKAERRRVAALETKVRLLRAVVDASRPITNPTEEQRAEATGNYFIALDALAAHDKERT